MKKSEFKNILKEIFREVIQEELPSLLEESLKSKSAGYSDNKKESKLLKEDQEMPVRFGLDNIKSIMNGEKMTTKNLNPPIPMNMNTMAEGSQLPDIEISEDLMAKLMGGGL